MLNTSFRTTNFMQMNAIYHSLLILHPDLPDQLLGNMLPSSVSYDIVKHRKVKTHS